MNVNQVVLIGRLVNDPETSTFGEKNTSKAAFKLAVSRIGQDKTDFIPVEVLGTQADNCAKYLVKGQEAAVIGQLRIDTWKKDGDWKSRTYVFAEKVQFGSKPNKGETKKGEIEEVDEIPF